MAYNAAEREDVKQAERASRIAEAQRKEVIVNLMGSPAGRAWVLAILERCHIFSTSFSGNALQGAFAEGERNVGLQLLNDIMSTCPDQYVLAMREHNERHQRSSGPAASSEHTGGEDAYGGDQAPDASDARH